MLCNFLNIFLLFFYLFIYQKLRMKKNVYAFITNTDWAFGERKTFSLRSLKGSDNTTVSVQGLMAKFWNMN